MKTLTIINVSLQFDIKDSEDVKKDARKIIKRINKLLEVTYPNSQPQIVVGESAELCHVDLPNDICEQKKFKL